MSFPAQCAFSRLRLVCLLSLLLTLLVAGCDRQELLEKDRYKLYPPHALIDPFTYNLTSDRRSYPKDARWLSLYHIVNCPDEDDDENFISVFTSTRPPLRCEVDLIPCPDGHSLSEEEVRKAREEAMVYWHAQGLKLWGSEAVFCLRKAFYEYGSYCDFTASYDSLKYDDREALLVRATELGNAAAAYLHTQAMIQSFVDPLWYKEYNEKYKGGLWGRLEYAAELGSPEAVLHMARCRYFGNMLGKSVQSLKKEHLVSRDLAESARLAEQSLNMGCVDSLPFLNTLYADPDAPCFDLRKAHAFFIAHEGLKQYYRISNAYFYDRDYSDYMRKHGELPGTGEIKPGIIRGYADKLTPEELKSAEEEGRRILETQLGAIEEKQRLRLEHYVKWRADLLRDIDQSMPWLRFMLLPEHMANDLRSRMYVWSVEKGLAEKIGPNPEDIRLKRALTWDDYMEMDHEYRMEKWRDISFLFRWRYARPGEWKPERRMWDNWSWEAQRRFWELVNAPQGDG